MAVMATSGNEKKQQLNERTAKFANGIRGILITVGRLLKSKGDAPPSGFQVEA
jgi:hypothetical protein